MRYLLLFAGVGLSLLGPACSRRPTSPLAQAAARNDAAALGVLLAAPTPEPDELHDPLTWAARHGATEAINVLIAAGADVNQHDAAGNRWSPLQHAVHTQQPRAVRVLLEWGADPDLRLPDTPAGHQALWWARMHDCDEVLALVGARPTVPGQKVVGAVGFIRELLGVPTPKDVLRGMRATDAPSRR